MTCETDVEAWKRDCRIPLFPGQWNEWIAVRTLDDGSSVEDVPALGKNALKYWFRETALLPGITMGDADNISVEVIGTSVTPQEVPLIVSPAVIAVDSTRRAATIGDCSQSTTLRAEGGLSAHAVVRIRFVYRGEQQSMSWPAARAGIRTPLPVTIAPEWCPNDADWLILFALRPNPDETIPESAGEKLKSGLELAGKRAVLMTVAGPIALATVAVVVGVIWVSR